LTDNDGQNFLAGIVPFNRLGRCYALEQVATPTGRSPLIGADKIKTEISRYIQKRKLQNSCKIYNCRIGNDLGVRVTGSNAQLIEILKTESNERKEQFGIITNLLQEQNHQRDRMLTLLEGLGGQKRKRPSED
jgi:hypothetical protein